MKQLKLLALAAVMLACAALQAQDKKDVGQYFGASLSVSNGTGFGNASFASAEYGITVSNWSLGLCAGRKDLAPRDGKEQGSDYFWEPKATASVSMGAVKGFALFGAGGFFDTETYFVEYGFGVAWPCGPVDLSTQYSNWAGADYVSIGFSRSF